jgi:hypothetical protein
MNSTTKKVRKQPDRTPCSAALARLQDTFAVVVKPAVERHAAARFRHVRCPGRRADLIADAVALAWKWFQGLAERGKDGSRFAGSLAVFAARAVNVGRRVTGRESGKDALSPRAQRRHDFAVSKLPDFGTLTSNPLEEALVDDTRTPVPDQAAFRIDFPAWLATLAPRERALAEDLAMGHSTREMAEKYGVCDGRISQLRRELHADWERFHGQAA